MGNACCPSRSANPSYLQVRMTAGTRRHSTSSDSLSESDSASEPEDLHETRATSGKTRPVKTPARTKTSRLTERKEHTARISAAPDPKFRYTAVPLRVVTPTHAVAGPHHFVYTEVEETKTGDPHHFWLFGEVHIDGTCPPEERHKTVTKLVRDMVTDNASQGAKFDVFVEQGPPDTLRHDENPVQLTGFASEFSDCLVPDKKDCPYRGKARFHYADVRDADAFREITDAWQALGTFERQGQGTEMWDLCTAALLGQEVSAEDRKRFVPMLLQSQEGYERMSDLPKVAQFVWRVLQRKSAWLRKYLAAQRKVSKVPRQGRRLDHNPELREAISKFIQETMETYLDKLDKSKDLVTFRRCLIQVLSMVMDEYLLLRCFGRFDSDPDVWFRRVTNVIAYTGDHHTRTYINCLLYLAQHGHIRIKRSHGFQRPSVTRCCSINLGQQRVLVPHLGADANLALSPQIEAHGWPESQKKCPVDSVDSAPVVGGVAVRFTHHDPDTGAPQWTKLIRVLEVLPRFKGDEPMQYETMCPSLAHVRQYFLEDVPSPEDLKRPDTSCYLLASISADTLVRNRLMPLLRQYTLACYLIKHDWDPESKHFYVGRGVGIDWEPYAYPLVSDGVYHSPLMQHDPPVRVVPSVERTVFVESRGRYLHNMWMFQVDAIGPGTHPDNDPPTDTAQEAPMSSDDLNLLGFKTEVKRYGLDPRRRGTTVHGDAGTIANGSSQAPREAQREPSSRETKYPDTRDMETDMEAMTVNRGQMDPASSIWEFMLSVVRDNAPYGIVWKILTDRPMRGVVDKASASAREQLRGHPMVRVRAMSTLSPMTDRIMVSVLRLMDKALAMDTFPDIRTHSTGDFVYRAKKYLSEDDAKSAEYGSVNAMMAAWHQVAHDASLWPELVPTMRPQPVLVSKINETLLPLYQNTVPSDSSGSQRLLTLDELRTFTEALYDSFLGGWAMAAVRTDSKDHPSRLKIRHYLVVGSQTFLNMCRDTDMEGWETRHGAVGCDMVRVLPPGLRHVWDNRGQDMDVAPIPREVNPHGRWFVTDPWDPVVRARVSLLDSDRRRVTVTVLVWFFAMPHRKPVIPPGKRRKFPDRIDLYDAPKGQLFRLIVNNKYPRVIHVYQPPSDDPDTASLRNLREYKYFMVDTEGVVFHDRDGVPADKKEDETKDSDGQKKHTQSYIDRGISNDTQDDNNDKDGDSSM